jgi:hypothetical protein
MSHNLCAEKSASHPALRPDMTEEELKRNMKLYTTRDLQVLYAQLQANLGLDAAKQNRVYQVIHDTLEAIDELDFCY